MPKKIKLTGLKVQSFITSPEQKEIRGGATQTECHYPTGLYMTTCNPDMYGTACAPSEFSCEGATCSPSCRYCCMTDTCF